MRTLLLTAGIILLILFLYAQLVRRTSMFIPSTYPVGNWDPSSYSVRPEDVEFQAADGIRLHGWLFRAVEPALSRAVEPALSRLEPPERQLYTIVWFHGNAGNITDRAPTAAELARRGASVLLFDWRGYGKSEGSPSESALYRDAVAAYDFARAHTTGDIVPYGESLGGPYAAYVAAHRRVRCVVIENSTPSLAAIANAIYRPFPMGIFVPFALSTTRWLNQAGAPVLVMHGKRDQVLPFALGKQLYDALRVPKEMLISETAGHCEIATAEPERYYEAVTRFARR